MKILISADHKKVHTFSNFESANLFCRAMLGRVSNLEYAIISGSFERSGIIDMEPVSFHSRNKVKILTLHLETFSKNILKEMALKKWPFNKMNEKDLNEDQNHFIELLSILPDTIKF
jgi:hypothetical protein